MIKRIFYILCFISLNLFCSEGTTPNLIAAQSDGRKIFLEEIPTGGFRLSRHNLDGSIDNTFGINGVAAFTLSHATPHRIQINPINNEIHVIGSVFFGKTEQEFETKFTPDGILDQKFGQNGVIIK
ncbi:hypothetical protein M1446_03520 [Candidatus Dependentiae bacterium]|nr:hypothetical protein [Candidatus Dependentiae bacterium]